VIDTHTVKMASPAIISLENLLAILIGVLLSLRGFKHIKEKLRRSVVILFVVLGEQVAALRGQRIRNHIPTSWIQFEGYRSDRF